METTETAVFYFSGTGNSLAAAKTIAAHFGCPTAVNIAEIICCRHNSIYSAPKTDNSTLHTPNSKLKSCVRVIVVYPSYAYGMPAAVKRFFQAAEFRKDAYIAALVTYGSKQGGALAEAKRLLRRRRIKLSYARGIPAVENFLPIFGTPKKKTILKRTAMQKETVAAVCQEIEDGAKRAVFAFRPFCKAVSALFRSARRLLVKLYKVESTCTGCGICQKICQARAITMTNGKPEFSKKCEICQCCINFCPQKAISFLRVKPKTPRYTNADVTLSEFIMNEKPTENSE